MTTSNCNCILYRYILSVDNSYILQYFTIITQYYDITGCRKRNLKFFLPEAKLTPGKFIFSTAKISSSMQAIPSHFQEIVASFSNNGSTICRFGSKSLYLISNGMVKFEYCQTSPSRISSNCS